MLRFALNGATSRRPCNAVRAKAFHLHFSELASFDCTRKFCCNRISNYMLQKCAFSSGTAGESWVRALTPTETSLQNLNDCNTWQINLIVRFTSSRPVGEEEVHRAFKHVLRKTPNLRLCVQEKGGRPWWKCMGSETLNWQVVEDADIFEEFIGTTVGDIDSFNGPLWKIRLLPWSESQTKFLESTSSKGTKPKHAHVNHFLLSVYHSIGDGFTGLLLINSFLSIMDDIISGKEIDDSKQLGVFIDPQKLEPEMKRIRQEFLRDPKYLQERREDLEKCLLETDFEKAYPVPPFQKPDTGCVLRILDEPNTSKLLSKCRQEGVTVHAAISAAIEASIVKLLEESNLEKRDEYRISSAHTVLNRAFYESKQLELGHGVGHFTMHNDVPADAMTTFWDFAKCYAIKLKNARKQRANLQQNVIKELTNFSPIVQLDADGQGQPCKQMKYYMSANMTEVSPFFGDFTHVQLEYFCPFTKISLHNVLWLSSSHTLRGELVHSLQFNSHLVNEKTTKLLSDTLFQTLEEVTAT